jgi:membrane protein
MFSLRQFFKLGDISYKELGKRVLAKISEDSCATYAAAMAYYLLFALFPFFLFLTTLIGFLPIHGLMDHVLAAMQRFLPGEAFALVGDNVKALFTNKKGGLLSLGFVLALWTSSSTVTSAMEIMNRLYRVKEGRPFWKVRLVAMFLVIVLSILFIVSVVLLMFGPTIGHLIARIAILGSTFTVLWSILIWPVILFLLILATALTYYFTPDVQQKWRWISPGAVIAIPVWIIASFAFSFYVNNFGSYNKTYGSIGAVIVLLLWLYISGFIILVGAEINSVIEHSSEEGKEPGEKKEGQKEVEPEQVESQQVPAQPKR